MTRSETRGLGRLAARRGIPVHVALMLDAARLGPLDAAEYAEAYQDELDDMGDVLEVTCREVAVA